MPNLYFNFCLLRCNYPASSKLPQRKRAATLNFITHQNRRPVFCCKEWLFLISCKSESRNSENSVVVQFYHKKFRYYVCLSVSQSVCTTDCRTCLPVTGRSPKLRKPPHSIVPGCGTSTIVFNYKSPAPSFCAVSLTKIGRNKVCTILRTNEQKEEN